VSHVVAKAAQVSGELGLRVLARDLTGAFERFLVNPVKTDPGCRAKVEIARALYEMGDDPGAVFPRGIRHRQLEPVYGGREDTAPELRAVCALGLVRVGHPDTMVELADLLADPEAAARTGAIRAIAFTDEPGAEALLRLKALAGDSDAGVVSECLGALLSLAPARSLEFATRFLAHADPVLQEAAALALGASRLREALAVLRTWWERTSAVELRRTGLLAIAMLRHEEAIAFLVTLISGAAGPDARAALAALGTYRHDEALRARVRAAVEARNDLDLRAAFATAF
jgi:HEAT repeat protein